MLDTKIQSHSVWRRKDMIKIAKLIFEPSLSTVDQVNRLAGRGIGLDAIKKKIEKNGGSIEVEFKEGEYCEFSVSIPIKLQEKKESEKEYQ